MRILVAVVSLLIGLCPGRADAQRADNPGFGQRRALIIGNANYEDGDAPLREPVNDARALAQELRRCGFDVALKENLARGAMQQSLDELNGKIKPGSAVFFFFSGYGVQSNRQSYLIPINGHIWTEADVRRDGLSLDVILSDIGLRGAAVELVVLDASRRTPFERRLPRKFSAGLAPALAPNGSLIMYSAAPGAVIDDAETDRGILVSKLVAEMSKPGSTADDAFNHTRIEVSRDSQGVQVPWVSSLLTDTFAFCPGGVFSTAAAAPSGASAGDQAIKLQPSATITGAPGPSTKSTATEIDQLDTRILNNPSDASALYKRGQLSAQVGDFRRAAEDFGNTLRLNPRDVEALNNRCWSRAMTGELQLALKDCDQALELRPDFVDALDSRGLVNLKLGLNRNAIADYDAALRLSPAHASSLYGRGVGKLRTGGTAEGNADIAAAKKLDDKIADEFAGYGVQ